MKADKYHKGPQTPASEARTFSWGSSEDMESNCGVWEAFWTIVKGGKRWTRDWGRIEERCLGVELGWVTLAIREHPGCGSLWRPHQTPKAGNLRQKYPACLFTSDKGPGRGTPPD